MIDLSKNPIIYVARDAERALGLSPDTPGYFIITNKTQILKTDNKKILMIKSKKPLDTHELLSRKQAKEFINKILKIKNKNSGIVVFKPTEQIEKICAENNWNLLNPKSELAKTIEEKISQIKWLGSLSKYLPPHKIKICKNIKWQNKKFILQFNIAHTGSGTYLIETEKQLKEIAEKFPDRPARITEYIEGPAFTSNNIILKNKIIPGNINYQITGLWPFTENKFATIGNDWSLSNKILTDEQRKKHDKIACNIGKKMQKQGWRGLFGIDIICEEKTGKIYLIEINARQPASVSFESQLNANKDYDSCFEMHLKALAGIKAGRLALIKNASQIILRKNEKQNFSAGKLENIKNKIEKNGLKTITYKNTKIGSDLLRIQSKNSIMTCHKKLNSLGSKIAGIISAHA
jgi:predicted ATP-grasp superfamily ATP-dependent carboligase